MRTMLRVAIALAPLALAAPAVADDFQKGFAAYNSANYQLALETWQPLAESGDAQGQYGMGLLYGNGFGVEMNDEQALHWYGLAAAQGHGDAAQQLAIMHQNGWGVPMNDEVAIKWYRVAADQGIPDAMRALGTMYNQTFSPIYDKSEAYRWFSIAARLGDLTAQTMQEELARSMTTEEVVIVEDSVAAWFQGKDHMLADE